MIPLPKCISIGLCVQHDGLCGICFSESGNRHTVYSRGFVLPDTGNQRKGNIGKL